MAQDHGAGTMVHVTAGGDHKVMSPTILIIDDNPAFRVAAERLLTARGLKVVGGAGSYTEGAKALHRLRPDGVLLDIRLPDNDGYNAAGQWRREADALVVVLTSTEPAYHREAALAEIGVRAFVPKQDLASADLHALFVPAEA